MTTPKFPLKAYNDLSNFKIYLNDVGLLRQMVGLDSKIIADGHKLFEEFKGSLTENYVLNTLINNYNMIPNYFTFDRYQIDYIIQFQNQIIPIEVKAGKSTSNKSLTKYNETYNPRISVRCSFNNLSQDGNVVNVPLFMLEYLDKFICM